MGLPTDVRHRMAAVQGRVSAGRVLVIEAIETEGVTAADTWGIGG